jgi:CCR4-NOT transcription complex subunit 7/8
MVSSDTYAQDSIDMLSNSAGIDFSRSIDSGIDQNEFGELLITSGLVLLEDVTWITFTGYPSLPTHPPLQVGLTFSGYDLGYLLKTMTSVPLPPVDTEFFDLLTTYFPSVYGTPPSFDMQVLTDRCPNM